MEKENVVSIWIGNFNSEEEFRNYIKEEYSEDGNMKSSFMNDFGISFYDNQFFEAAFINNPTVENIIAPLSYSEFFKDEFRNILSTNNVVIAIYNFQYEENSIIENNLKFINSFNYDI